ncbi:hypothetical protein NQ315_013306 [Exocentrus adspersus]|uniref:Uncharacterized protein n=1 Tax=Exocentrus adspersus TaxID=1586481 RepID=A0AAV8VGT4_9CUCU|nr:hypothetical protein NQ315_013306 [Exocentrus adspersus]
MIPSLSEEHLKELVPLVGQRIKLKEKMEEHMEIIVSEVSEGTPSVSSVQSEVQSNVSESADEPFIIDENTPVEMIPEGDLLNMSFDLIVRPKFSDFDLYTLLQTSPLGNSVLNFYKSKQCLDNTRRSRLVDIVIKHLYTYIIKHRLKHDDYIILASKIIQLFPNEVTGTYYVPSVPKNLSPNGKSILARGKLVDKCRNIIHKCGEASVIRRKHINKNDDFNWLKYNTEPWATVIQKWNHTFTLRRKQKYHSVSEMIRAWPVLNDLRAEVLINCDFEKLFPKSVLNFFLHWQTFFETLLKQIEVSELTAKNLIETLETCQSEDGKLAIQITLLSHLIPPRGRLKVANHHWKFSILEAVEAIVVNAKDAGQVNELIERQRDKAAAHKQTVQPYLLLVGPLEDPQSFFIVIDTIKYELDSAKKAFDTLFKIFHVLDAKYPIQAEHIWVLIQKGLYKVSTPQDIVPPYILHILNSVETAIQ